MWFPLNSIKPNWLKLPNICEWFIKLSPCCTGLGACALIASTSLKSLGWLPWLTNYNGVHFGHFLCITFVNVFRCPLYLELLNLNMAVSLKRYSKFWVPPLFQLVLAGDLKWAFTGVLATNIATTFTPPVHCRLRWAFYIPPPPTKWWPF